MSDVETSVQFRDKSISQLVQQLNNLGDTHITMQPTTLIGIIDRQSQYIRRFRSRSMNKSGVRSLDGRQSTEKNGKSLQSSKAKFGQLMQFFLTDGSQKKYYYNEIVNELQIPTIGNIMNKYSQGFNTTILMEYKHQRFQEIIRKIQPWLEGINSDKYFYASFIEFQAKQAIDLLSGKSPKTMSLTEASQKQQQHYLCTSEQLIKLKNQLTNSIKILRINKKQGNSAELRFVFFPSLFLMTVVDDPSLKIVKSQLSQIINYIKMNPNKKYENINKLLPKRYPTTTAVAEIILYDSANFVVNWVSDQSNNKNLITGRFDFYDKLAHISNLVNAVNKKDKKIKIGKAKKSLSISKISQTQKNSSSEMNMQKINKVENNRYIQNTEGKNLSDLQYCRSLQRKTHKYSLAQFGQADNQELFPQTILINHKLSGQLSQNEVITILKAQHTRQISQYHQTIQNLNQKILVLTSQKGMSEIFTIHQRQIMLLELKIQELRKDISKICNTQSKQKQIQDLRDIIKKLNEQIIKYNKSSPSHKVSQGKIKMMERELIQWKQKFNKSQIARKQLRLQLQAAVNRLKIKDQQTERLLQINQKNFLSQELSSKQQKQMEHLQFFMNTHFNGLSIESKKYIMRKFKNLFGQISELRQVILQSHNFLVDLQDHIQQRLSQKDPQVVLDCNRFIRTYLLNNMNIF